MGPEKKIQNKIQKTLKSLGIYVERRQISGVGAKKGKPDLWIVRELELLLADIKKYPVLEGKCMPFMPIIRFAESCMYRGLQK